MTLEEAKKLLKKEGFHIQVKPDGVVLDRTFHPFEKPSVKEAVKVLFDNGLMTCMNGKEAIERSSRLFKEHNWVPVDKNPASNESVKEFNDALLDEQAKKISAYQKQFKHLAEVLHKKNIKIEQLRKESSKHLRDKIKVFYENQELEKKASKYANVLADLSDKLRQTKFELTNAKSSNAYLDVLRDVKHSLVEKDAIIQEKDEVIRDLGEELAETKKRQQQAYRSCAEKNKDIRALKLQLSAWEKKCNDERKPYPTEDNPEGIKIKVPLSCGAYTYAYVSKDDIKHITSLEWAIELLEGTGRCCVLNKHPKTIIQMVAPDWETELVKQAIKIIKDNGYLAFYNNDDGEKTRMAQLIKEYRNVNTKIQ